MHIRNTLVVALLLCAVTASAQSTDVEEFLIPIHPTGRAPGAFGSLWTSELTILNVGRTLARVENVGYVTPVGAAPLQLMPGTSYRVENYVLGLIDSIPAAVLRVDRQFVEQLEFHLRIRDLSREGERWGTWLPVVHQSRFEKGRLHLLDVPNDDRYRMMLRVYSLDAARRSVRVRIFGTPLGGLSSPPPQDDLLTEFSVALESGPGRSRPDYLDLDASVMRRSAHGRRSLRVEVEPEGDFSIWAMLSVTNNVTQEVTMIFPARR